LSTSTSPAAPSALARELNLPAEMAVSTTSFVLASAFGDAACEEPGQAVAYQGAGKQTYGNQ